MADQEHLKILKQGVDAWNKWRAENPEIIPDLSGADLRGANLRGANLIAVDLSRAILIKANLQNATLWNANLERAWVTAIKYDRSAHYRGIRVATCYGSPRFKRFAQDQDYIEELKGTLRGWLIWLVWWLFADCGRSFLRWAAWSALFALGFAWRFYSLGSCAFDLDHLNWSFGAVLYYSVVTFTTLGFGDVTPKTMEAAWWVMAEVVVGYIMLGGLISILATKLARRS